MLRDIGKRVLEGGTGTSGHHWRLAWTSPGIGYGISVHIAAEVLGTQAEECGIKTKAYEPGRVSGADKEDIPDR